MSGKPVHREAAEAGTYAAQTVFINKRLFCHFIDCCEIIFHALAAIIAADSFRSIHYQSREVRDDSGQR